jgi:hypothetical protein
MPLWRKDGGELYYITLDRRAMAVEIRSGSTLETGTVKTLFQVPGGTALSATSYAWAVTGNGQKFLIREAAGVLIAGTTEPINIVLNWPPAPGR